VLYAAPVLLPLIGAIIAGFFGRFIGARGAQIVTCTLLGISALLAVPIFASAVANGEVHNIELVRWIDSGTFEVAWSVYVDSLTAVMILVVTWVSFLVHVYSIGYMSHDPHIPRFFAYLSLFTFFMLALVTSNNFVQLYFGWEGVGLASYLLINFWYTRPSANAAAIKAFLVNRVGDFGFALGIFAIFLVFDALDFPTVFAAAPEMADTAIVFLGLELDTLTIICLLLFVGCMGKSAQLGLHTWLPDAMEGPTPVSALIHAATMVTAGVFLVARCSPLFELAPVALGFVAFIGASTAFFAATVAITQNDIKRVIAYSTCSQLGYMFFACGVSAYAAGIFHLYTHAFFKALLFLGSGAVIHALGDEQDMRRMGGLWRKIPFTYAMMWVGSLALIGIPPFAGFFSKDIVLEAAWAAHSGVGAYAFWLGLLAAVMTAFYSVRLIILTFHGEPRAPRDVMHHAHEAPLSMNVPNALLAVGALGAGYMGLGMIEHPEEFWHGAVAGLGEHSVLEEAHHVPTLVVLSPLIAGLIGIGLGFLFYMFRPELPGLVARRLRPLYLFSYNKWYFDELYEYLFRRPALRLGWGLWRGGDGAIIDGFGPDGVAASALEVARRTVRLQTGYIYHYAFAMLIGLVAIVTFYLLTS
jgi:NADH-quinone oxidoreductase subunit L